MKIISKYKTLGVLATVSLFAAIPFSTVYASSNKVGDYCNPFSEDSVICDNFLGKTFYKNAFPNVPFAIWYKYTPNPDNGAEYINLGNALRLEDNTNTTANHYTNADISSSEINNPNGNFIIGENTRIDVYKKFSSNIRANPSDPADTARGSSGLLLWNYFDGSVNPENLQLGTVRDAFGFVWQDPTSFPLAGFYGAAVVQGVPGAIQFFPNIDLTQYHTYSLEWRHTSMSYFIDNQLLMTVPLNVPGALSVPSTTKLSVDNWIDNMTYVQTPPTYAYNLHHNTLTEVQYTDIGMISVKKLED